MSDEVYGTVRDAPAAEEGLESIGAVVNHVVRAGYAHANHLRIALGVDGARQDVPRASRDESVTQLEAMVEYVDATFEGHRSKPDDDPMWAISFESAWGPTYDIEQMLEHTIVHVLRHRRQIERYLWPVVDTDRCSLSPVAAGDEAALHAIWTDEAVRRFLWDGKIIPVDETRAIIEESRRLFASKAYGIWILRAHGTPEVLGFAGFWPFHEPPRTELFFGLAPSHWHRGIATECARRLIDHAFEALGHDRIEASTDDGNEASVRVLERIGMRFDRRETMAGRDTIFYRIEQADWQATADQAH